MIGSRPPISQRPHRLTVQRVERVPTDGGYTETWVDVPPRVWASIDPSTAQDLERVIGTAVVNVAAPQTVRCPYHPGLTTETRLLFGARIFAVLGASSPEERRVDSIAICSERQA